MPYEAGTATDPADLLTKIVTFLTGNGWTLDTVTSPTETQAHIHRSGVYVHFCAAHGDVVIPNQGSVGYGILVVTGTGFDASKPHWYDQAGVPKSSDTQYIACDSMNLPNGAIVGYQCFLSSDSNNFVVVVERTGGNFVYIGFGTGIKTAGAITGGVYHFGSASGYLFYDGVNGYPGAALTSYVPFNVRSLGDITAHIRCDVDAFTGKYLSFGPSATNTFGYTGKKFWQGVFTAGSIPADIPHYQNFQDRQTSVLNGLANLLPIRLFAERDGGGHSLIGTVPEIFGTNAVGHGFSANTDYAIGSDTYRVFPNFAVRKVA